MLVLLTSVSRPSRRPSVLRIHQPPRERAVVTNSTRVPHVYELAEVPCRPFNKGLTQQAALLSLRDRAMLHVIEYFAKSLELAQGH